MSNLRTPFEARGHLAPWTSLAEGDAYLDALLAESPNLTERVIGQSVQGAPMRLFRIGTGSRRVLIVCQQHGEELSGREAAFTLLREWAHTSDPAMLDYLTKVTLLVIPTAHPDDTEVRENKNGFNLNRDHVQLSQPETQAIYAAIRDYNPDVVVDVHEGRNITRNYATGPALNGNIDAEIAGLSLTLEAIVQSALTDQGYTVERYQGASAMIGAENLCNGAGINNRLSILLETRRSDTHDDDADIRHEQQLIALRAITAWHRDHLAEVTNAVTEARGRASARTEPIQLMTGTLPFNGAVVDPLPTGYLLDGTAYVATALHRDRFQLQAIQVSPSEWVVPTDQPGRVVASYLLDSESTQRVTAAARDFDEEYTPWVPPGRPPLRLQDVHAMRVQVEGQARTVKRALFSNGAQTYTVWP